MTTEDEEAAVRPTPRRSTSSNATVIASERGRQVARALSPPSDTDSPRSQWSTGAQPGSPRVPPASSEARVPYGHSKAAALASNRPTTATPPVDNGLGGRRVSWAGDVPNTAPTRETAQAVSRSGAPRTQGSSAWVGSGGNPLIRCSTVADVLGNAPARPSIPEARSKAPAVSTPSAARGTEALSRAGGENSGNPAS